MSKMSRSLVLGFGLVGLVLETIASHPAFATNKTALFRVVTPKDDIVIGMTEHDLARFEGHNADGIAKTLKAEGTLSVWRYAVRRAGAGDLEQAPAGLIGLMATDALRIEPYTSSVKVVPIEEP